MTDRQGTWLWSICTVIAAALAAWFITRASPPAPPLRGSEQSFHHWLHANLDISEAQHRELEPFEKAYEAERVRLRKEIRQAGEDLARAIAKEAHESPEVTRALERLHAAQGGLQRATLNHFFVMKDHLNPSQAERLLRWTQDNILDGPSD